jgi:cyclic-di-GMP-binding protein
MISLHSAKSPAPPQHLAAPTLFAATVDSLTSWMEALPKANLGHTARAVYQAIEELNRVDLTAALRLQLLEIVRPALHFASAGLRRHYLNQPIVLSEQAQRIAQLAHELHDQLATGYALIAQPNASTKASEPASVQLATAVHRGITEYTLNLLRDYQLYRDVQQNTWRAIHQLANLARSTGIETIVVADTLSGDCSVHAAYLRALLLGSAKSTQLRQEDLAKIFQHAPSWAALCKWTERGEALLVVDPLSDEGPIYRQHAQPLESWLGLETRQLARHLSEQSHCLDSETAFGEQPFSGDLLAHLAHNWGSVSTRAFMRIDVQEQINVVLGLNGTHHLLAGEIDLQTLLNGVPAPPTALTLQEQNPFLSAPTINRAAIATQTKDVWDTVFAPSERLNEISMDNIDYHIRQEQQKAAAEKDREKKSRRYAVKRINISAGGFCIGWPQADPAQVRTGEIVGINEDSHAQWSIGVIRWLRMSKQGPKAGVELLSPCAYPYGARVIQKTGPQGDYQRVLLLPAVKQTGQPTTLLMPRLPFRAGQKISLLCRGRETRIQLIKRIVCTPSFNLYEFRRLSSANLSDVPDAVESVTADTAAGAGFNGLWEIL